MVPLAVLLGPPDLPVGNDGDAEGWAVSLPGSLRGLIASDWVLPWLASVAIGIAAGLFQMDERMPRRPGRYWYSPPGATAAALRRWAMARERSPDEGERRLVPNSYLKQLAAGFPYSRPRRD